MFFHLYYATYIAKILSMSWCIVKHQKHKAILATMMVVAQMAKKKINDGFIDFS